MALPTGPLNALPPKTSFIVGAVFNSTPPTPTPGQGCALQVDSSGNLKISGTFSGGNAAAGLTGSAVPTSADYIGFNSGGLLVGVSAANPLPISGSISATNPSVGPTGSAVPADATAIGVEDGSGNLQIASSANPVRVDPTGTTTQPISIQSGTAVVKGNVASGSAVSGANAPVLVAGQDGTDVRTVLTSSTGQLHVIVDSGGGGGTQYTDETAESAGAFTGTVSMLYNGTDVVGLRGDASNNLLVKVNVALPAGTNVIGHVIVDSGTITTVSAVTAITNAVTVVGDAASGAAVAGNPVLVGGSDGTDARTISTNASGQLVVVGAGTAGSGSGGVLSVQGVASGVSLPVTATIAASQTIAVTQATASSLNATVSIAAAQTLATVTTVGAVTAITNALPAGSNLIGQVEVSDGTNVLFTSGHPGYVNDSFVTAETGAASSATWTSSTSLNTALTVSTIGFGNAGFSLVGSGTIAGGVISFEYSWDGTNWLTLGVVQVDGGTSLVTSLNLTAVSGGGYYGWQQFVGGFYQVRIRLSTVISGGGNVVVSIRPSVSAVPFSQIILGTVSTTSAGSSTGGTRASNSDLAGGIYNVSSPTLTNGQQCALQLDTNGNLLVNLTSAPTLKTESEGTISATVPGFATYLGVNVGTGLQGLTANSSSYSSKYGLDVNLLGTLGTAFTTAGFVDIKGADGNVFVRQATAANFNATVVGTGTFAVQAAQSGTWTVGLTSGTGPIKIEGNAGGAFDAATNTAPPANAVQVGYIAATALPSANTATELTVPMTDKFGRQVVLTAGMRDILAATGTTITSTTGATTVVAAVASTYCDITSLTITNSSGTATLLTLNDGTNSYIFSAAAGPGWGITIPFNPPLPAASVNTAWTVACGTSVASVYVVAQYVKNK